MGGARALIQMPKRIYLDQNSLSAFFEGNSRGLSEYLAKEIKEGWKFNWGKSEYLLELSSGKVMARYDSSDGLNHGSPKWYVETTGENIQALNTIPGFNLKLKKFLPDFIDLKTQCSIKDLGRIFRLAHCSTAISELTSAKLLGPAPREIFEKTIELPQSKKKVRFYTRTIPANESVVWVFDMSYENINNIYQEYNLQPISKKYPKTPILYDPDRHVGISDEELKKNYQSSGVSNGLSTLGKDVKSNRMIQIRRIKIHYIIHTVTRNII
jgi:hypothetical protein